MQVENLLSTYEPHACIIVYAISDRDSFNSALETLQYLSADSGREKKAAIILVGNKTDQEDSRMVSILGK